MKKLKLMMITLMMCMFIPTGYTQTTILTHNNPKLHISPDVLSEYVILQKNTKIILIDYDNDFFKVYISERKTHKSLVCVM